MRMALSFLGPFQVTLAGEAVQEFESDTARALLAYLAIESGCWHQREALAEMLWPERPQGIALSNLRSLLSRLRQTIGDQEADSPFLLITRQAIRFNPESDHYLDVAELTAVIGKESPDIERLEKVVTSYRGRFLEGLSLADSVAFEEWLLLQREESERLLLRSLHLLAAHYQGQGQYERARSYARWQLQLEPWNEEGHRQLIRLLALSGQRSAALAQYETCRRLLAEELGVEPSPETTALYQAIRAGKLARQVVRETSAVDHYPITPLPLADEAIAEESRPLFVAREVELERLGQHLEEALGGQGQVAFVVGEAGSGKTTLLGEFARRAMDSHQELIVALGSCNAYTGMGDPYLPFLEILQLLTGEVRGRQAGGVLNREHARRLWTLLPLTTQALVEAGSDLIDVFLTGDALLARAQGAAQGRPPWLATLEEVVARKRAASTAAGAGHRALLEQYCRVLLSLARKQPLLLVVDDLQWADSGSINLLFHLGRRLAGSRILLLGAYRPADVALGREGERHPLEPVVNELQVTFGDILVDLDQAEGRCLVDALVDSDPNCLGGEFRRTLYRHTGGHALFTVETLRSLQERGELVRDDRGRWVERSSLDWGVIPARVEAAIAERLGRLPQQWQETLAAASVQGEEFLAEVVARVLGVEEKEIIHRLSREPELVRAQGLERIDGQRLSRYRFRHYLFQCYLYESLDAVERAHLHEATGMALEELYGQDTAGIAVQLAWHFEEAKLAEKAVRHYRQAGELAFRLCAYEEAVALLSRGLALLRKLHHSPERDRQEMALQLAFGAALELPRGADAPEILTAYARARELARLLGETTVLHRTSYQLAMAHWGRAEFPQALDVWEENLRAALNDQDSYTAMMAHSQRAFLMSSVGEFTQARAHYEQMLALYDPKEHRSRMLREHLSDYGIMSRELLGAIVWLLGYPDQAWEQMQQALAEAQALGHRQTLMMCLRGVCVLSYELRRDTHTMRQCLSRLERLAAGREYLLHRWYLQFHWGRLRVLLGHHEEGIAQMRQVLEEGLKRSPVGLATHLAWLAEACGQTGRTEEGLAALEQALAQVEYKSDRQRESEIWRLKGELLLQCHEAEHEAEACFWQAIQVARHQEAKSFELRATSCLARLLAGQGKREEARQMLAAAYGWFTEGFDTYDLKEAKALLEELR